MVCNSYDHNLLFANQEDEIVWKPPQLQSLSIHTLRKMRVTRRRDDVLVEMRQRFLERNPKLRTQAGLFRRVPDCSFLSFHRSGGVESYSPH